MVIFQLFSLTLLLSFPLPIASRIETAFLQNSPAVLREILTTEGTIPVSLPEPLSLADQLSPDQTFLVFDRIFSAPALLSEVNRLVAQKSKEKRFRVMRCKVFCYSTQHPGRAQ